VSAATFAWPSVGSMNEEKKKEAQEDKKDEDFLAGKNKGKSAAARSKVGRCWLTVSNPVLKEPMVSVLEIIL